VDHELDLSPRRIGSAKWRQSPNVAGDDPAGEDAWGRRLRDCAAHLAATDGAASFGELSADKRGASWDGVLDYNSRRIVRAEIDDPDTVGEIRPGLYCAGAAFADRHIGR